MKKILALLFVFSVLVYSCNVDENTDPDYPFVVTIKTLKDSTRVANVYVEILAQLGGSQNKLLLEGFTNERGEVTFKYDQEAVLLIRATRGTKPQYTWIGCDFIFLEPNTEVGRTVYIRPYSTEVEGC